MRRVIIESPYAGDIRRNTVYARLCLLDSIRRGEAPIASHLIYPQVLDEQQRDQRRLGLQLGYEWMRGAELVAFYRDFSISTGMTYAMCEAQALHLPIENRYLSNTMQNSKRPFIVDPRDIELELGLHYRWWHRFTRSPTYSPPERTRLAVQPIGAAGLKSSAENQAAFARSDLQHDEPSYISDTLSRDAPSPVPWGEPNNLE